MLPWLFAVLLVLNAALFFWGYQRERSREPVPPELPQTEYSISLLSEVPSGGASEERLRQGMDWQTASTEARVLSQGQPGSTGQPTKAGQDAGIAGTRPAADLDAAEGAAPPARTSPTGTRAPGPSGNELPEPSSGAVEAASSHSEPPAAEPNPADAPIAEITDPVRNAEQPDETPGNASAE
jgi:hypothetical protein